MARCGTARLALPCKKTVMKLNSYATKLPQGGSSIAGTMAIKTGTSLRAECPSHDPPSMAKVQACRAQPQGHSLTALVTGWGW